MLVDGSSDADAVSGLVAEHLPPSRPGDAASRSRVRRWENDVAATQLRLWAASGEGPAEAPAFEFACECGRSGCSDRIELTPSAYAARAAEGFLVAGG